MSTLIKRHGFILKCFATEVINIQYLFNNSSVEKSSESLKQPENTNNISKVFSSSADVFPGAFCQ